MLLAEQETNYSVEHLLTTPGDLETHRRLLDDTTYEPDEQSYDKWARLGY